MEVLHSTPALSALRVVSILNSPHACYVLFSCFNSPATCCLAALTRLLRVGCLAALTCRLRVIYLL